MSISQRERIHSQSQAFEILAAEFENLKWNLAETSHGESYPTIYSKLSDANGDPIQDGMGKGEALQATLSARFEALEHAITDLSQKMMDGVWKGSLQEAKIQGFQLIPASIPDHDLDALELKSGYWKTFSSSKSDRVFIYPLSKLDPFSDYLSLYSDDELYKSLTQTQTPWLRNNNGSAIGASEDDALLHAYNEAIERYSLSSLYVDAFLKTHPRSVKIVRKNSLPVDQAQILAKIESENKVTLSVIDMTSELDVPSFAVLAASSHAQNLAVGYGTSIYPDYALQRALLECQQMLHTRQHPDYGPINLEEREEVDLKLASWPKLKAAVRLDLNMCHTESVRFPDPTQMPMSVFSQRRFLEGVFQQHDIEIFSTLTYRSKFTSICAVRVLVPDFSDFSFIEAGLPVTPSGRVLRRFFEDL